VRPTVSRDVAQRYERLTEEFARQVVGGFEDKTKEGRSPKRKSQRRKKRRRRSRLK